MTDIERILYAIKAQRWYFFANNPKILMDRDTAIVWANLNYFPYRKNNNQYWYSNSKGYSEVKTFMSNINSENWGGFSDWKIPTPFELMKLCDDKSFPFHEGMYYWKIKDESCWCVYYNGILAGKMINYGNPTEAIYTWHSVCILPCSSKLVPQNFSGTPQEIFDILKSNELIPIFDDEKIIELYKKVLTKPLQDKKSTSSFDCQTILDKYDVEAVDKSAIRYYEAVLSVVDELLAALPENDTSKAVSDKKRKLSFVKDQAESFFQRLDEINTGYDSIRELAKLEAEPRTSFAFLVESLTRIINEKT